MLTLIFVSNRYAYDNAEIERKHLCDTLEDRNYKLLTAQNLITSTKGTVKEDSAPNVKHTNKPMYSLETGEGDKKEEKED